MRILVTGGAGFIGSHLCKHLLDQGHQVVCLDNFYTGQKRNIEQFLGNANFELMEKDVKEPIDVKVDQIYNLACPASPVHYQQDPIETLRISIFGAINCLELSRSLGNIPVLQASTSEVYGDPEVHPQTEDYNGNVNPIGPRACYDEGKRCAETLFFDYHRRYNIPIKIVRIFNTYGPNMTKQDGRVVSNFINQAIAGQKLTVHGQGDHTRSFCYVSDMVEGLVKMMAATDFTGPVNLGNPNEMTIGQLAEKIISKIGGEIKYNAKPVDNRQGDPEKRNPNISLAKEKLSWEPKVSLDEGLDKTIEYFKQIL